MKKCNNIFPDSSFQDGGKKASLESLSNDIARCSYDKASTLVFSYAELFPHTISHGTAVVIWVLCTLYCTVHISLGYQKW